MRAALAHASWIIPLAAMASPFVSVINDALEPGHLPMSSSYERGKMLGDSCVKCFYYVIGLSVAIFALRSRDPREGEKKLPRNIKIPALIGLALNGVILTAMLTVLVMAIYAGSRAGQ